MIRPIKVGIALSVDIIIGISYFVILRNTNSGSEYGVEANGKQNLTVYTLYLTQQNSWGKAHVTETKDWYLFDVDIRYW